MKQNFIDLTNTVHEEFEKAKDSFKNKFLSVPDIETFIDAQIKRLENNRKEDSILKDYIVNDPFLNAIVSKKRQPLYIAGWEAAINNTLDNTHPRFIEEWPETFIQGAIDAFFYNWLQNEKHQIGPKGSVTAIKQKEFNRFQVALAYYYLHLSGVGVDLRDNINERRKVAEKYGISPDTFYDAYLEYVRNNEAMLSLGNKNEKTVTAKFDHLNGAFKLLKTISKSQKAIELALADLQKLKEKVDQDK